MRATLKFAPQLVGARHAGDAEGCSAAHHTVRFALFFSGETGI